MKDFLVVGNPFQRPSCGRKLCPWVGREEDCRGACYLEGAGYLASCKLCLQVQREQGVEEEKVVQHVYQGETHRSLHFRCERHHQDYRAALRKGGRRGRGG